MNETDDAARALADLLAKISLAARHQPRPPPLRESDFLALCLLESRGVLIVGQLQRLLGVLPAQMSRVIGALQARVPQLVCTRSHEGDRRKIDVELTEAGRQALEAHRRARERAAAPLLAALSDAERALLGRLLGKLGAAPLPEKA